MSDIRPWNGEENCMCVVWPAGITPGSDVEILTRDGARTVKRTWQVNWEHEGSPSDVIGYRVLKADTD